LTVPALCNSTPESDLLRLRWNSSSSVALENEASRAPATVPVAIIGKCCPGLQAKVAVRGMSFNFISGGYN